MATAADTIGAALVHSNLLQPAELERALIVNDHNGDGLGPLLVRLGLVSEQAPRLRRAARPAVLQEHEWPDMPVNLANLSHKFLKQARALPVRADDEGITLAVADPEDRFTVKAVEVACDRPVVMKLATVSQVERALERLYGGDKSRMEGIVEEIRPEDVSSPVDSIEELRNLAAEAPIVRLVNLIINRAMSLRASDIHIEPFENRLKVRYRIDGVLQEGEAPPVHSAAAVISRIKIMAKLNIAERRLPQDGRIRVKAQGKPIACVVPCPPAGRVLCCASSTGTSALDLDRSASDSAGKTAA